MWVKHAQGIATSGPFLSSHDVTERENEKTFPSSYRRTHMYARSTTFTYAPREEKRNVRGARERSCGLLAHGAKSEQNVYTLPDQQTRRNDALNEPRRTGDESAECDSDFRGLELVRDWKNGGRSAPVANVTR